MAEKPHPALLAAEEQAKTHAPKHLGDPRVALRAGGGFLTQGVGNGFRVELDRLVSPWHDVTSG
jgi:hypothetical protein